MSNPLDPSDFLLPIERRGLAATFKRLLRKIILPNNAISGQMRIVIGADTPAELQTYGVANALLFYVTDKTSGVELGYFFIGLSNKLDAGADQKVLLFGNVRYPTDGDPSSATSANVRTNHQINLYNTEIANAGFTIFKDQIIVIRSSVGQISNDAPLFYNTGNTYIGMPDGSNTGLFTVTPGSTCRLDTDAIFEVGGKLISFKRDSVFIDAPTGSTTTSATFVNLLNGAASISLSVPKIYGSSDTGIEIFMEGTMWMNAAAGVEFAANVSGTGGGDFVIAPLRVTTVANAHMTFAGHRTITGLPAGTKTITARWRRQGGAGTPTWDLNDHLAFSAKEVPI